MFESFAQGFCFAAGVTAFALVAFTFLVLLDFATGDSYDDPTDD
jgi:hypothetical protein